MGMYGFRASSVIMPPSSSSRRRRRWWQGRRLDALFHGLRGDEAEVLHPTEHVLQSGRGPIRILAEPTRPAIDPQSVGIVAGRAHAHHAHLARHASADDLLARAD